MFDEEYIRDLNAAYWAEEEELKEGVHPSQVIERIEAILSKNEIEYNEIT